MNLKESYNELYLASKAYNDLVYKEKKQKKRFSKLEDFIKENSSEIRRYELEADICRLIRNDEITIDNIEALIQGKRDEERLLWEQEELKRQKKNNLIKWAILLVVIVILTIFSYGIIWVLVGVLLYYFPNLRRKTGNYIKKDWEIITRKLT